MFCYSGRDTSSIGTRRESCLKRHIIKYDRSHLLGFVVAKSQVMTLISPVIELKYYLLGHYKKNNFSFYASKFFSLVLLNFLPAAWK